MRRTAALIVGGGPAGAAAAIVLARAGLPHLLVERTRETGDALCGGFLSWRSLDALARLGVEADALNPRRTTRLRLFAGGRVAEAALPRPAVGVSRRRLDTLLLARAIGEGGCVERGVAVRAIDGPTARIDDDAVTADALFLASGKHDVRGGGRPRATGDAALGLRVRLPADATLSALVGDAIELHAFERGYAGIVMQEDGSANVCMAVHRSRLSEAGGDTAVLLDLLSREAPRLGERLARGGWGDVDAVANVPYGWRARDTAPGLFRLGDQAAVIPSLAGEGMGIALASGARAAAAYRDGGAAAAPAFQRAFARNAARPLAVAGLVRDVAERAALAPLLALVVGIAPASARIVARLTRINHADR